MGKKNPDYLSKDEIGDLMERYRETGDADEEILGPLCRHAVVSNTMEYFVKNYVPKYALEVGCHRGLLPFYLVDTYPQLKDTYYIGIDLSESTRPPDSERLLGPSPKLNDKTEIISPADLKKLNENLNIFRDDFFEAFIHDDIILRGTGKYKNIILIYGTPGNYIYLDSYLRARFRFDAVILNRMFLWSSRWENLLGMTFARAKSYLIFDYTRELMAKQDRSDEVPTKKELIDSLDKKGFEIDKIGSEKIMHNKDESADFPAGSRYYYCIAKRKPGE